MIPQQIYDIFISFEEQSAELYLDLSARFLAHAELTWFWVEMAMEEKQHAGMLQYCKETGTFAPRLPDSEPILRLAGLFKRLKQKAAKTDLTMDDAFNIAIELEASEINEIYKNLTTHIEGPWYVLRKKFELSADKHVEHLKKAARRFGASQKVIV